LNIINSFSWLQWTILGLIPLVIVLLYFLKLRRQPLQVPSTFLWARTIEDLHVNSIWQRLRNSLLLWLQLLLLLLLLLTGLRPGCRGEELVGERFIFAVDSSASMSATDRGKPRLDLAKAHVENLIDRMKPDDVAMLISFSDGATVHQSYTKNKSLLKRKLVDIEQTQRRTDLTDALRAASGLANPGRTSNREDKRDVQVAESLAATLFIVSDGGAKEVPDFSLGVLKPEYHPIGAFETPDNVGIIAFSISTMTGDKATYRAFARLENFGPATVSVSTSLFANDELLDSNSGIEISAGQTKGINFDLSEAIDQLELPVKLRLELERDDHLLLDNKAYAILNRPRQARVLVVSDGNRFLEMAMNTERARKLASIEFETLAFMETEDYSIQSKSGYYDLILYDRCQPKENPQCNAFYIDALPPGDTWQRSEPFNPVAIIDFSRSHPIMQFLELSRLTIIEGRSLEGPTATVPLWESDKGSLLSIAPRAGFQDLVLSFPIIETAADGSDELNTDWPNHLSFPLIMQNIIAYLGGASDLQVDENIKTGQITQLKLDDSFDSIDIKSPRGKKYPVNKNRNNIFVFSKTDVAGFYDVMEKGKSDPEQVFAVNSIDRRESDIRVREKLEIGFEEVTGDSSTKPVRKEFWKWLIIAALVVLTFEWIVYNRRVFV
jgi:hypothetical protein